jgi:NAD(P)-dependent dehydrogenase (short-subunit alcohol dehydrogenase family)
MGFLDSFPRPTKTYHAQTYDRISPATSGFDAQGKTVLVTGGATGIGLSIVKSFAAAGVARIIIVSRSPGPQAEAKKAVEAAYPNTEVQTISASITDFPRISEIIHDAGNIDVLVLNAVGTHQMVASVEVPVADYEFTYHSNVMAPLHMLKEYLKQPNPGSKTVINISTASTHVILPGQSGYGSSKTAFGQILQHMAVEYSPEKDGVRLFSIHPGAFYTDAAKSAGVAEDALEWEDIRLPGDFSVWLASDESTFLHGRFVWAHWDVDELVALKERVEKEPSFLTIGLVL